MRLWGQLWTTRSRFILNFKLLSPFSVMMTQQEPVQCHRGVHHLTNEAAASTWTRSGGQRRRTFSRFPSRTTCLQQRAEDVLMCYLQWYPRRQHVSENDSNVEPPGSVRDASCGHASPCCPRVRWAACRPHCSPALERYLLAEGYMLRDDNGGIYGCVMGTHEEDQGTGKITLDYEMASVWWTGRTWRVCCQGSYGQTPF